MDDRQLFGELKQRGCTVEPTNGGHIAVTTPSGRKVFMSKTPSDWRSRANELAQLKRMGVNVTIPIEELRPAPAKLSEVTPQLHRAADRKYRHRIRDRFFQTVKDRALSLSTAAREMGVQVHTLYAIRQKKTPPGPLTAAKMLKWIEGDQGPLGWLDSPAEVSVSVSSAGPIVALAGALIGSLTTESVRALQALLCAELERREAHAIERHRQKITGSKIHARILSSSVKNADCVKD